MAPFTQKYTIIQLLEDIPVGTIFSHTQWPLHVTIADVFATEWSASTMAGQFTKHLSRYPQAHSVVQNDIILGDKNTKVSLLQKTDSLVALHHDVVSILEQGGWKPNSPQFAKAGFLPHATIQSHARLNKGDAVRFNTLSIIDMFPGNDPYLRKVMAIIPIGEQP